MPTLLAYLLAVNLAAAAAFVIDKRRAERGGPRIAERRLLLLAAAGGWPGAQLARHLVRHKTRKEPFASLFRLIGVSQATALGLLLILAR